MSAYSWSNPAVGFEETILSLVKLHQSNQASHPVLKPRSHQAEVVARHLAPDQRLMMTIIYPFCMA